MIPVGKPGKVKTLAYSVDRDFQTYWNNAKSSNYSCIMPVFDTNDTPVNPSHFSDKLVGAMCEVTFTLKHLARWQVYRGE